MEGSPLVLPPPAGVGMNPLVQVCPPSFDVEKPEIRTLSVTSPGGGTSRGVT